MATINHGKWVLYKPDRVADIVPANMLFARRESDGVDWYVYIYGRAMGTLAPFVPVVDPVTFKPLPEAELKRARERATPKVAFPPDTVKGAAIFQKAYNAYIVGPATRDASAIFPVNQYVFEVTGYTGSDPQKDFGGKVYDPKTGAFSERPELKPSGPLSELLARIEALEKAQR